MAGDTTRTVQTIHGETLDQLCWRALGSTVPVDLVYAENPGLAEHGPILPAGLTVRLPITPANPAPLRETITLWS